MSNFKSQFFNIMVERGFYNQCTNENGFDSYLYECEQKGTPAVGYLGSDPTGDSLHVGHIVPLMMLRWFQKCGWFAGPEHPAWLPQQPRGAPQKCVLRRRQGARRGLVFLQTTPRAARRRCSTAAPQPTADREDAFCS